MAEAHAGVGVGVVRAWVRVRVRVRARGTLFASISRQKRRALLRVLYLVLPKPGIDQVAHACDAATQGIPYPLAGVAVPRGRTGRCLRGAGGLSTHHLLPRTTCVEARAQLLHIHLRAHDHCRHARHSTARELSTRTYHGNPAGRRRTGRRLRAALLGRLFQQPLEHHPCAFKVRRRGRDSLRAARRGEDPGPWPLALVPAGGRRDLGSAAGSHLNS